MNESAGAREASDAEPAHRSTGVGAVGELFARLLPSLVSSIPFDGAELALLDQRQGLRTFSIEPGRDAVPVERRSARLGYSARVTPGAPDAPWLVRDTAQSLDASFELDRRLLDSGARSVLALRLRVERRALGLLTLWSRSSVLEASHAAAVSPIADLLARAADHERRHELERERERRHQKLEALLPALAEALDVRQVFLGMSALVREIVPHDIVAFALLTPDRGGTRVQAATHDGMREMPEYRFSNQTEALDANWNYLLANDLTVVGEDALRVRISPADVVDPEEEVVRPGVAWTRFVAAQGVRSTLRVPIRAKDRPIGGVVFMARAPFAYDEEDGALAKRIADHLALALAHQELAAEERRIAQAEERAVQLEARVDTLSRELERLSPHRAIGRSAQWKKVLVDATQVAATETTVLITGESGTGKEVVARFIHRGSRRARGPFVALNCAALPEQLLESELFGHERGAFTGALVARPGRIEQAAGGVLFLDEVGEMSPNVQAKLLRVLQEREFQRLGGAKTLRADVRLVAATNRDPRRAMETGAMREDLYYRLSVFEITLPPLRERPDDILLLAEAFLEEVGASVGRPAAGLGDDAREQLLAHSWPGNVRELRNAIERAVILCNGGVVEREHLPISVARASSPAAAAIVASAAASSPTVFPKEGVRLDAVERELLQQALARAGDNKSQAARLLGVTRGQLYSLLRRHGLTEAKR